MSSLKLGIDFGTSNSSVATVLKKQVKLFDLGGGELTQPSSIFIRADGYHSTGSTALTDFQTDKQKKEIYHFIPTIKPGLHIGQYSGNALTSHKMVKGRYPLRVFSIEELASFIISDLKQKAELATSEASNQVVLGRPVFFSTDPTLDKLAEKRLEDAAKIAGFKSITFLAEPIAAALYYERTKMTAKNKKVFVFDFGGGTLDTCILELKPGEKINHNSLKSRVIASHGVDLGGKDLDKQILSKKYFGYLGQRVTFTAQQLPMPSYLYRDLPEWHLTQHLKDPRIGEMLKQIENDPHCSDREAIKRLGNMINKQQVYSLLQIIEKAKIEASNKNKGDVSYHFDNIQINDEVTLTEFEEMIEYEQIQAEKCVKECLNLAQIPASEIDLVLRVGGSSLNPFVGKILHRIFNRVENTDLFTSVVAGLSLAADELY